MARDVRMKGFAKRTDVEVVDRFLAERLEPLPGEGVPLLECVGRVLALSVRAEVNVPNFARSAMDGYAVRGEDTFGASAFCARQHRSPENRSLPPGPQKLAWYLPTPASVYRSHFEFR